MYKGNLVKQSETICIGHSNGILTFQLLVMKWLIIMDNWLNLKDIMSIGQLLYYILYKLATIEISE